MRNTQGSYLLAEPFEDPHRYRADRVADDLEGQPCGEPLVLGDGVEQSQRDGADLVLGRGRGPGGLGGQGGSDDGFRRRVQQLVPVADVVVDRPRPGGQAIGHRPDGQRALTTGIEQVDRGVDDLLLREHLVTPVSPACSCWHVPNMTHLERCAKLEQ
ncbi:hypothetical protein ACVWZD_006081 [Streptomyces sp. TE3672]